MVDAMLTKEAILPLVNARLNRVLLIAQAALPEHQFEAFRRLNLDEFGRAGLIRVTLPLNSVVLSRSIMRLSSTVPRSSYSRTASG